MLAPRIMSLLVAASASRRTACIILWTTLAANWMAFGVGRTDATCSEDQSTTCSKALTTNNWSTLASGGECMVKQYVYFTHVCTVNNYLPNIDYCCCVQDSSLLCCRYHQGWNHFRCVESDDIVETLGSRVRYPPVEVLLPSILIPVVLLLICLACCVRKCCFSRYDDDNKANDNTKARCSCRRCYENMCGYELALDADDSPAVQTTYHRHEYLVKDTTETPTTVCSTDGQGLPYSTEPAFCYTSHCADRPTPLSPSAFCADCTARRLSRTSSDYMQELTGWTSGIEPSAPPDDSDSTSAVTFCLGHQDESAHISSARRYRYVFSSSSGCRQTRSGSGGRPTRPYFRSLIPGGDGAFPVPPPAYDDS